MVLGSSMSLPVMLRLCVISRDSRTGADFEKRFNKRSKWLRRELMLRCRRRDRLWSVVDRNSST